MKYSLYVDEMIVERKLIIAKYCKRRIKSLFYWLKLKYIQYEIKRGRAWKD